MDLNKLTEKAQEAIATAQRDAEQRQNTQLEPEHLLAALVAQDNGVVPAVLDKLGVPPSQVTQRVTTIIGALARATTSGQQIYVSPRFRQVFEAAQKEAERLKDDFVSAEHFLLAMADEPVLRELGVTRDRVLQALQEVRGSQRSRSQPTRSSITGRIPCMDCRLNTLLVSLRRRVCSGGSRNTIQSVR